jgi:hypothetical protein
VEVTDGVLRMAATRKLEDLHGVLWSMSSKLRGLGEMFVMCNGEIPMSEGAYTGFGHLLEEFADELDDLQYGIDNQKISEIKREKEDPDDEDTDDPVEDPTKEDTPFASMMTEFTRFLQERREQRVSSDPGSSKGNNQQEKEDE